MSDAGAVRPDQVVGRNFLALGSAESVGRLIAFVATIYLARVLGVAGYGVVALAAAVLLYLVHLADFGVEVIGVREVAEDRRRVATLAPALLTARMIFAVLIVAVVIGLGVSVLPGPEGIVIALFALSLLPIAAGTRWIHLGLESARPAAVARLARDVVLVVLVLALVRGADDLFRVPIALFAGECVASLILLTWLVRGGLRFSLRLELGIVAHVARRAWPIVLHELLGLFIYNADLIFLRVFRDARSVGYYAAGYTLISFLLNLGVVYCTNLLATLSRLGSRVDSGRSLHATAAAQVFAASLPISLGAVLLAREIIGLVFGPEYGPAASALEILAWSVPFSLSCNVSVVTLVACGRQDLVPRMTAWGAGLNLVLNTLLVPSFGIRGAAVATLMTEVVRFALGARYVSREGFRAAAPRRIWRPAAAGGMMAATLALAGPWGLWVSAALGAVVYLVALTLLGGVRLRGMRLPSLEV